MGSFGDDDDDGPEEDEEEYKVSRNYGRNKHEGGEERRKEDQRARHRDMYGDRGRGEEGGGKDERRRDKDKDKNENYEKSDGKENGQPTALTNPIAKVGMDVVANLGRSGGVYIPPFKLARMMKDIEDKSSVEYQRMTWDALRKSINGLVNKVNATNGESHCNTHRTTSCKNTTLYSI